jgi:hypothetical protein
MKINNLKELQAVIRLAHKSNITEMTIDGVTFKLGASPTKKISKSNLDYSKDFPEANIQVPKYQPVPATTAQELVANTTADLTEEQLLFYSAQGHVEN